MKFKAYFQDEMNYLKDAGNEFSRLNPRLVRYLSSSSSDPEMERLIEGFAFLTARLRHSLDDELSDLTQSVLRMLWSGFLSPIPPLGMLKFTPIDRAITERHQIASGMNVRSDPIEGIMYDFVTTAQCNIYPLELKRTKLERSGARSTLTISFSTLSGLPLSDIDLEDLRLWLTGDATSADTLYLWMRCYLKNIQIIPPGQEGFSLPPDTIQPGGLDISEALLPGALPAFDGYRLLQEYYAFPQKFRCLDLVNLKQHFARQAGTEFDIEFHFDRPIPAEVHVSQEQIQLYCTPIINLTSVQSVPFETSENGASYLVKPATIDGRHLEIFSVDDVWAWHDHRSKNGEANQGPSFMRYEDFAHVIEHAEHRELVYFKEQVMARQSGLGMDTSISFVRHDGLLANPDGRHIGASLSCFQPDASQKVAIGDISVPSRDAPSYTSFSNITTLTRPMYPDFEEGEHWKLISALSQNSADITDRDTLVEILRIYDYPRMNDRQAEHLAKKRLNGIVSLTTKPVDRLFKGRPIRGISSRIEMDDEAFDTVGQMYLFSGILAEFFSIYATQNSFHQLEVVSKNTGEVYRWPAKRGKQPLI